jgi:ABC-type tungstate transport system, periplasmic component
MGNSFERAFKLIFSNDNLLREIVFTTLRMSLTSSLIALLVGAPIGVLVASANFPGKSVVIRIMRAFMSLPSVLAGLLVYILFSGVGPFGKLRLVYTVQAMIIAQVVLITPLAAGITESFASSIAPRIKETAKGLNLSPFKTPLLILNESKFQLVSIYLVGFSRAVSEVGAVQIVGGNILHKTRVMTTVIALNYNTGQFSHAIAFGIILLFIALTINVIAGMIQEKLK